MPLQIKTFSLLLLQKMQNNIILSTFSPFTPFSIFCPATHYRGCFFRLYCKVNQHTMNKAYGKIVSNFSIDGSVKSIEPLGNGLINDIFKVSITDSSTPDYGYFLRTAANFVTAHLPEMAQFIASLK